MSPNNLRQKPKDHRRTFAFSAGHRIMSVGRVRRHSPARRAPPRSRLRPSRSRARRLARSARAKVDVPSAGIDEAVASKNRPRVARRQGIVEACRRASDAVSLIRTIEIPARSGSQPGSQRSQTSGDIRPLPPAVNAANRPIERRQATCGDASTVPSKERVAGSNPAGRTLLLGLGPITPRPSKRSTRPWRSYRSSRLSRAGQASRARRGLAENRPLPLTTRNGLRGGEEPKRGRP
jgi:hypothetical protein